MCVCVYIYTYIYKINCIVCGKTWCIIDVPREDKADTRGKKFADNPFALDLQNIVDTIRPNPLAAMFETRRTINNYYYLSGIFILLVERLQVEIF